MDRVYLSNDGYEKMSNELEHLKNVKRREIAAALNHARSLGDLSENAEYDAAKEAFAQNEAKIQELEDKLSRVEIIDHVNIVDDKAYVGAKVTLLDIESGEKIEYKLVGPDESDPLEGLISIVSPVGKSLLGKGIDEQVQINVPAGILNYKIISISR